MHAGRAGAVSFLECPAGGHHLAGPVQGQCRRL